MHHGVPGNRLTGHMGSVGAKARESPTLTMAPRTSSTHSTHGLISSPSDPTAVSKKASTAMNQKKMTWLTQDAAQALPFGGGPGDFDSVVPQHSNVKGVLQEGHLVSGPVELCVRIPTEHC